MQSVRLLLLGAKNPVCIFQAVVVASAIIGNVLRGATILGLK